MGVNKAGKSARRKQRINRMIRNQKTHSESIRQSIQEKWMKYYPVIYAQELTDKYSQTAIQYSYTKPKHEPYRIIQVPDNLNYYQACVWDLNQQESEAKFEN